MCPYCGASSGPGAAVGGKAGSSWGWKQTAIVLVVALGAANVWQGMNREVGPDPEQEALHSPEEAVQRCRVAIDSAFAARDPEIVGPLEAEYLQGGEYEVTGTLDVLNGRARARQAVLCELQFTAETGWRVEHLESGSG